MDESIESRLPESILQLADDRCNECGWRLDDVEAVLRAARDAGFACLGGRVQFRLDGTTATTAESYWLNCNTTERGRFETWPHYVDRTAEDARDRFRRLREETDFAAEARYWPHLRERMDAAGFDPMECLWFVLVLTAD